MQKFSKKTLAHNTEIKTDHGRWAILFKRMCEIYLVAIVSPWQNG